MKPLVVDLWRFLNQKVSVPRLAGFLIFALLRWVPASLGQPIDPVPKSFNSIAEFQAAAPQLPANQPVSLRNCIITYTHVRRSTFVKDATGGLLVNASSPPNLHVDDVVDLTGNLYKDGFSYYLRDSTFEKTGRTSAPTAQGVPAKQLLTGKFDMSLVQLEARVLTEVGRVRDVLQINLKSGSVFFRADLVEPETGTQIEGLLPDSLVKITGVCTVNGARDVQLTSFRILLRSPADLSVLHSPPIWTLDRILILLGVVTGIALVALGWVVSLRYQVRRKTDAIQTLNDTLAKRVDTRTAALAQANKELEAFSYSISHDLKAPLRAIRNFSQFLSEDYSQALPEEGRKFVKLINEGAQRMDRLIEDLLLFSKLSRAPLRRQAVNMNELLRECFEEVKAVEPNRAIELDLKYLPPGHADAALLRQVFLNLLSNSVKYTRPRADARIEIGSTQSDGETTYYVKDNGVGFDLKYAHKLFGVFQRLHSVDEFEGTGAGLAIVQQIVKRHGGRVWAESAPDMGATFFVTLGRKGGDPASSTGL